MLIILTGPAGGGPRHLATALVTRFGPASWVGLDHCPDREVSGTYVDGATYEALGALAERMAHPNKPAADLRVLDLDAIGTTRAKERAPEPADFAGADEIKALSRQILKGEPVHPLLVVHSISRLYEDLQARVLSEVLPGWGEKGVEAARTLASNAIARITWDFAHNDDVITVLTCWDTETTLKGKVVGSAPYLPRATLQQADFQFRVTPGATPERVTLETLDGSTTGSEEIDPATYDWPQVAAALAQGQAPF